MATVHLPPPEVRVTYWGFDLAVGQVKVSHAVDGGGGPMRRTKGVKGADDAAICGKVVLLEGVLLGAVHGGTRRGVPNRRAAGLQPSRESATCGCSTWGRRWISNVAMRERSKRLASQTSRVAREVGLRLGRESLPSSGSSRMPPLARDLVALPALICRYCLFYVDLGVGKDMRSVAVLLLAASCGSASFEVVTSPCLRTACDFVQGLGFADADWRPWVHKGSTSARVE